eukprot:1284962-Amphidinium_carterae.2
MPDRESETSGSYDDEWCEDEELMDCVFESRGNFDMRYIPKTYTVNFYMRLTRDSQKLRRLESQLNPYES